MDEHIPLFLRPNLDRQLDNFAPSDRALVEEFAERGYVVFNLDLGDLPDRIMADVQYPSGKTRAQDAWRQSAAVRALALDATVEAKLTMLYGREPFAFQTLNFPVGTEQLTHSDTIHFSSTPPDFMAGVWVALEDIDAQNGPLHYYPGSHRLPHITMATLGLSGAKGDPEGHYVRNYEPAIEKAAGSFHRHQAHLKRGQALIWSANLLHGGDPILDPTRTRHSQVTHYYFRKCRYWTPLYSTASKTYGRYPYNVQNGRRVTPLGDLPIPEFLIKRAPGVLRS